MNVKIKTYLDRLAASEKRPNSFLFSGADEEEKIEAAFYFVQNISGKAGDSEFLEQIKKGIHPDVVILEPEIAEDKKGRIREKEIVIEQVREARERLKYFPYELREKFCIIKRAQRMNAEASNALLKIIEEPTESTFFIILSSDLESVLPTIASRCAILRFAQTELPVWKNEYRVQLHKAFKGELHEKFEYIEKISKDRSGFLEILSDWEKIVSEGLRKLMENRENMEKIKKVVQVAESIRSAINQLEKSNAGSKSVGEKLVLEMNW